MNFGVHPFKTQEVTVKITVSGSSRCTCSCVLTHSESHVWLVRVWNTNLCVLGSENMCYPHMLIQLLTFLILLQHHIHFSSCSSLHSEQSTWNQFVSIFSKTVFIWLRLGVSVSLENQFSRTIFNWLKLRPPQHEFSRYDWTNFFWQIYLEGTQGMGFITVLHTLSKEGTGVLADLPNFCYRGCFFVSSRRVSILVLTSSSE